MGLCEFVWVCVSVAWMCISQERLHKSSFPTAAYTHVSEGTLMTSIKTLCVGHERKYSSYDTHPRFANELLYCVLRMVGFRETGTETKSSYMD